MELRSDRVIDWLSQIEASSQALIKVAEDVECDAQIEHDAWTLEYSNNAGWRKPNEKSM